MPIVLKSGRLNLLEPSLTVQACNGIAVPFFDYDDCLLRKRGTCSFFFWGCCCDITRWHTINSKGIALFESGYIALQNLLNHTRLPMPSVLLRIILQRTVLDILYVTLIVTSAYRKRLQRDLPDTRTNALLEYWNCNPSLPQAYSISKTNWLTFITQFMSTVIVVAFYYLSVLRNEIFCPKIWNGTWYHCSSGMLRSVAVSYRRFEIIYRSHLQGPSSPRRLGGPQSRSGRFGDETKLLNPAGLRISKNTVFSFALWNCSVLAVVGYIGLLMVNNV